MARGRRDALQAAEKLVARGKIEAAIKQYNRILKQDPSDTSTLNKVGDLYVRVKRLDEAIDLFRRAAEHFAREEFFVKAIAIYKKIIRLDPTRIDVYETLADLYHRQGLTNEARTQYQVVADYFTQGGDTLRVISIQEQLVELSPSDPTPRVRLAELYTEVDRLADATAEYREIATFMVAHDKVSEAVEVYRSAFELDSTDLNYLTDALFHLKDEGHRKAALKLLDYAVDQNPDAERTGSLAGLFEEEPGAIEEAPEEAEAIGKEAESVAEAEVEVEQAGEPLAVEEVVVEELAEEEETPAEVVEEPALEEEDELVLEIDSEPVAEPPIAALEPEEVEEIELDLSEIGGPEGLPAMVDEQPEGAPDRVEELFTEARILSNYGLGGKAIELCDEILSLDSGHLEANALSAKLYAQDRHERAVELAESTAVLAKTAGREEVWLELTDFLVTHGYEVSGTTIRLLEIEEPAVRLGDETEEEALAAAATETAGEDERLEWLQAGAETTSAAAGSADELFGEEEEFFDLAAELEEELRGEELLDGEFQHQPSEQSLEEIVEGFRRGVAETLSTEDYDTHYNLGIAYREMGLLDEAIGEFQLSAKDPRYLVECCSLLGACFLEKGFPDLAVKWFERGLTSPNVSEKETLGLLYELGNLYVATGERESALETFSEIYGTNSNYRDVVARLAELKQSD